MRYRSAKKRVFSLLCSGALCAVIAAAAVSVVFHGVWGKSPALAVAEDATVETSLAIDAIFFYEETVVYAKDNGLLEPAYEDGDLVSANAYCVSDTGGKGTSYQAPLGGILRYEIDGCEDLPFPDDLRKIQGESLWQRAQQGEAAESPLKQGLAMCHNGDILFKIANNKKAVQCLVRLEDQTADLTVGNSYELSLAGTTASGKLLGLSLGEEALYCVFSLDPRDQWFQNRFAQGTLTVSSSHGVTVDNRAITRCQDTVGIYVVDNGIVSFQPLEILLKGERQTVVKGIDPGYAYFLSPEEGAKLKFVESN
ncbi:MAG: HlyD family efflux transporter periplasmic adaptor subunit [Bacillota bacterium]|nr:HlyD family efflux transporter periplasmic adaptor subunit [Bacillota bacterium]